MIALLWLLACNPFGGAEPEEHEEHGEHEEGEHGAEGVPEVVTLSPGALATAELEIEPAEERTLRAVLKQLGWA